MRHNNYCFEKSYSLKGFIFILLTLALISCGGNSHINPHPAKPVKGTTQNSPQKGRPTALTEESEFELELRKLINGYRRDHGLAALSFDPHLHSLARQHSEKMGRSHSLSHDGFKERFEKSGCRLAVENVAFNYTMPQALFDGWQNSTGHNSNMLHPGISHAGIAKAEDYVTFFAGGNKTD